MPAKDDPGYTSFMAAPINAGNSNNVLLVSTDFSNDEHPELFAIKTPGLVRHSTKSIADTIADNG